MKNKKYKDLLRLSLDELMFMASEVRRKYCRPVIELCGIMNAKSGACSEDCKYCAQSVHYPAKTVTYPLKDHTQMAKAARVSRDNGAGRFGIVTSGNRLSDEEVKEISAGISAIKKTSKITPCASLGELKEEEFRALKKAGLKRYHHNIETSPSFYGKIVSTHSFADRIKTIKLAKKCGLEICSGGIIGLGETWGDRVEMALALKRLDVDSVPLNFLVPIRGTPLEKAAPISACDALKTIALFRIILKDKNIRVAAGREKVFSDIEAMMFFAGATGMMIGGYLTTNGRSAAQDVSLARKTEELWKKGSKKK